MLKLKNILLICTAIVMAMTSMSTCDARVLQTDDLKLIEGTCKNTPNPNLCLQLLKADPRSPSADIPRLGLILVDVIKAKSIEVLNKVKQLLKGGGDKKALNFCAETYHTFLIANVPVATQALQFGDPKFAEDAVSDSSLEATYCEQSFKGKSPLTKENNFMRDVSDVARAVIRNLL